MGVRLEEAERCYPQHRFHAGLHGNANHGNNTGHFCKNALLSKVAANSTYTRLFTPDESSHSSLYSYIISGHGF
jgi:hypothetical protein